MPSTRTVRSTVPSFLGGLAAGLLLWRWLRRGDVAEIDRQRLEGEAESERLRLRLNHLQEPEPTIDLRPGDDAAPALLSLVADDQPDDLQRIKGIGPKMEQALLDHGIRTYAQIAALTSHDIDELTAAIGAFPGRIEREDWVGSARRILATGADAPVAPQRP